MQTQSKGKRFIKLAVSSCVFLADCLWAWLRLATGKAIPPRCVVLYYHSIPSSHRDAFACQMDVLLRCVRPLPADVRHPLVPGTRYAVVTFDDALDNMMLNALPELVSRKIPATVFVVTDSVGEQPAWKRYERHAVGERVMTTEQLLALPAGLIGIGSHTKTHPMLTRISEQEAWGEIAESRAALERLIGRQVKLLSFPYGDFNESLLGLCRKAGYLRVFTILPTYGLTGIDEFATGRVWAEPDDWPLEFRLKLFGAYRWLVTAFALKKAMQSHSLAKTVCNMGRKSRKP